MASLRRTSALRLLDTVLGRQMFALFVACALLPILTLSILSWVEVGAELESQSRIRLHHGARRAGMMVLDRLRATEEILAAAPDDPLERPGNEDLSNMIASLHLAGPRARTLVGEPSDVPTEAFASLDPARPGLIVAQRGASAEVWLRVPRSRAPGHWLARVDPAFLFEISHQNALPPAGEACIATSSGRVLWSSHEQLQCRPSGALRDGMPALRGLEIDAEPYFALDWLLFLDAAFQDPGWTLLVAEPQVLAMAPVDTFRTLVLLISALTFSIVAYLSARQIRRQLSPLAQLESAASRVRAGNFGVSVPVESNDELGRVSQAFNEMSAHLSEHFSSLERLIEIDRAILSATNRADLISAVLDAVSEIAPSDVVGVVLPDEFDVNGAALSVTRRRPDEPDEAGELPRWLLTSAQWYDENKGLMLAPADRIEPELREVFGLESGSIEVYPLTVEQQFLGFVFRRTMGTDARSRTQPLRVRQLGHQIASAVHGLTLRSKNERLLRFDSLTGLPNLQSHEDSLLKLAREASGQPLTVIRVSITGMSRHAKTHGQERAEELLRCVADELCSMEGIQAARVDSASFGAFFLSPDMDAIMSRLRSISSHLRRALDARPGSHGLGIVIGSAMHGFDDENPSNLIHKADIASRHSVPVGVDSVAFFSESMESTFRRSSELEASLERAISNGELRLDYQPIVDAHTREVVAAEALLRWTCPLRGPISPEVFIPIAEDSGLIQPLGEWVLRRAFEDVREWRRDGLLPLRVSVNVSASQVTRVLPNQLASLLEGGDARPEDVGIELTESALLGESDEAHEVIGKIREMGFKVSIDDFGTGYSSLEYLKRFDVDVIKIDRSFLQGVPHDKGDCGLTRAAIAVGSALGLQTVAEGCETEAQLAFLREAGCDMIQGYLFSKALSASDFKKLVAASNRGAGAVL